MKNQLTLFAICALFGLLMNSCTKDNEQVFPVKFYPESIEVKSAARMFRSTGEVKNAMEISTALNGTPYFSLEKEPFDKNELALTFTTEDSVVIGNSDLKFSVKRDGKQFLFYSKATIRVDADPRNPNGTTLWHLLKYTYNGVPISRWNTALTKETRVAYGNFKEIRLSAMAYLILRSSQGSVSSNSGLTFNEFNSESATKLQPDETVIVKEYELVLRSR
ncbi:hypothetical protein [Pedobacter sp. GR22-6]|uniref:hypothetical protein n=1 Tax=Pedobacter sp. GR22-6 TaxID=3127957 RepID=UPI00307D562F